jgi:hypothetical protein
MAQAYQRATALAIRAFPPPKPRDVAAKLSVSECRRAMIGALQCAAAPKQPAQAHEERFRSRLPPCPQQRRQEGMRVRRRLPLASCTQRGAVGGGGDHMTAARHDGWPSGLGSISPPVVKAAAWCAVAFWLYYAFLRQVAGPLNPDEIYFSHTLWLVNEGKRQYLDFYSIHLPAYFQMLKPLVNALSEGPADLSFVWGIRSLSGAIILGYLALGWLVTRRALPHAGPVVLLSMWALLLVFIVLARMVEVRTDTFGLLLVNAAWALALCGRTARTFVAAAVLAGLALVFSARAAGMVTVMGLLLLFLAVRARDATSVRALLGVAAVFVGSAIVGYLAAPEWTALVVRSCFMEPAKMLAGPTLMGRFFAMERLPLTILIAAGLGTGAFLLRREPGQRGLIVAMASAAQLLMIGFDPAPYQYVYGWAAVPVAFGVASLGPVLALLLPSSMAAGLLAISVGYSMVRGHAPATISYFRLTFDAPLSGTAVARLSTPKLVALLISDAGQKNLANQLRIRSEVCRRLRGKVLTTSDTNPICLDDATFYWSGLRWPPIANGDVAGPNDMSEQEFARMFILAHPTVFIWGHRWGPPRTLLPGIRKMLACCYDIQEGFALADDDPRASALDAGRLRK